MSRLLLVEPDRLQAELYLSVLQPDHQVQWVRTTQAAVSSLDKTSFDAVISETTLDHHNGIELLNELRAYDDWLDIPIVFLSALARQKFPLDDQQFKQYGVAAFLNKSDTRPSELRSTINEILA